MEKSFVWLISTLVSISLILSGCAASAVSRNAADNVDQGFRNAAKLVGNPDDANIATSYQNTSQATKGAFMGGAAGAVLGYAYSTTIGVLPGIAIGTIFGAAYGKYIDSYATPQDKLINRGVNVMELGDQISLVIPSWRIFGENTATIDPQSYSTLQMISNYINFYTKMLVKISVYTADSGSPAADCSLSQLQADTIERFLIASGINARVLYAKGYGATHLVANNELDWGSPNYRIEITFERLYV